MYISYINKSTNQSGALFTCRNIQNSLPLRQRCKAVSIGNWVTAGPTKVMIWTQLSCWKGVRFIQAYPGHYLMLRIKYHKISAIENPKIYWRNARWYHGLRWSRTRIYYKHKDYIIAWIKGLHKVVTVVIVAILFIITFSTDYWYLYNQMYACVNIYSIIL